MRLKKLLAIIFAACLLTGCSEAVEEEPNIIVVPEKENVKYSTAIVTRTDIKSTKSVSCTYQQQDETTVIIPVAGKVVSQICVAMQEKVTKGQLLIQLGESNLESQIEELEYKIRRNEIILKYLDEEDKFTREDLEDEIYLDGLALEKLKEELGESRIYAECDGVITWIKTGLLGSTTTENERVMTIVDAEGCIFTVTKNNYTDYLSPNENVTMKINMGEAAGLYELVPYNTENWGKQLYYVLSPDYDGSLIKVGATGYITVVLGEREQVLKLPAKAIHATTDKSFVYVLDENDVRTVKWVQTGLQGDNGVEITEGLSEGEKVLLK